MLQRKWIVLVLLVCLVGGGAYYLLGGDEDETVINRNLDRLIELAEKSGDESPFVTIGNSREAMKYLAQEPRVHVGPPLPEITDRRELEGSMIQVRQSVQTLSIRVVRRDLVVAEDGKTARMELEAEATVNQSSGRGRDRREFTIEWVKEEGDWVIETIRLEGDPVSTGGEFPSL